MNFLGHAAAALKAAETLSAADADRVIGVSTIFAASGLVPQIQLSGPPLAGAVWEGRKDQHYPYQWVALVGDVRAVGIAAASEAVEWGCPAALLAPGDASPGGGE